MKKLFLIVAMLPIGAIAFFGGPIGTPVSQACQLERDMFIIQASAPECSEKVQETIAMLSHTQQNELGSSIARLLTKWAAATTDTWILVDPDSVRLLPRPFVDPVMALLRHRGVVYTDRESVPLDQEFKTGRYKHNGELSIDIGRFDLRTQSIKVHIFHSNVSAVFYRCNWGKSTWICKEYGGWVS